MKAVVLAVLLALSLPALQAFAAGQRVMIILQENSGRIDVLPANTPPAFKKGVFAVVDRIAETFEDIKSDLQGDLTYNKVIHLTDDKCTREQLLVNLIQETANDNEIDLYFFGHGNNDRLLLHDNHFLVGGEGKNLRALLTDARAQKGPDFKFNLRLVYMCACFGATMNDDWRAIGARVSVGSQCDNYMAEPMITSFIDKYVMQNKTVATAAQESYNDAVIFWAGPGAALGYAQPESPAEGCMKGVDKFTSSLPVVAGDGSVTFRPPVSFVSTRGNFRTIGNALGTTVDDKLTGGTYVVTNASAAGKLEAGTPCSGQFCPVEMGSSQSAKWILSPIDGILGGYTLTAVSNNKVLDADLFTIGFNGTKVQSAPRLSPAVPRTNQEWKIVKRSDGNYTIKNILSGRYLDAESGKIQLQDGYSAAPRRWKLVRAQ